MVARPPRKEPPITLSPNYPYTDIASIILQQKTTSESKEKRELTGSLAGQLQVIDQSMPHWKKKQNTAEHKQIKLTLTKKSTEQEKCPE